IVAALYHPVHNHGISELDDSLCVIRNPRVTQGLTASSIQWAYLANFSHDSPTSVYWAPLTLLSRLVDWEIWGSYAGGHHLTSLLLHACNVVLLFFILFRRTGSLLASAAAGLMFALHPANVEAAA